MTHTLSREQAFEATSEHVLPGNFRVNAHSDARRWRRIFNIGQVRVLFLISRTLNPKP